MAPSIPEKRNAIIEPAHPILPDCKPCPPSSEFLDRAALHVLSLLGFSSSFVFITEKNRLNQYWGTSQTTVRLCQDVHPGTALRPAEVEALFQATRNLPWNTYAAHAEHAFLSSLVWIYCESHVRFGSVWQIWWHHNFKGPGWLVMPLRADRPSLAKRNFNQWTFILTYVTLVTNEIGWDIDFRAELDLCALPSVLQHPLSVNIALPALCIKQGCPLSESSWVQQQDITLAKLRTHKCRFRLWPARYLGLDVSKVWHAECPFIRLLMYLWSVVHEIICALRK